jgi:hypothetical protein
MMANFAMLDESNVVLNVIVADSKEIAEDVTGKVCVPCEGTHQMGNIWNGSEFIVPESIPAE